MVCKLESGKNRAARLLDSLPHLIAWDILQDILGAGLSQREGAVVHSNSRIP